MTRAEIILQVATLMDEYQVLLDEYEARIDERSISFEQFRTAQRYTEMIDNLFELILTELGVEL